MQRDNAEVGMPAIHFLEHGGNAAHAHEFHRLAKAFDGGKVAKAVLRPEIGNFQDLLEGAGAAHQLPENRPYRGNVERALVALQHVAQDFFFTSRRKDLAPLGRFQLTYFGGQRGPLVNQF